MGTFIGLTEPIFLSDWFGNKNLAELADGVGFEPTRPLRACRFSRPVLSTAQPPIQVFAV